MRNRRVEGQNPNINCVHIPVALQSKVFAYDPYAPPLLYVPIEEVQDNILAATARTVLSVPRVLHPFEAGTTETELRTTVPYSSIMAIRNIIAHV